MQDIDVTCVCVFLATKMCKEWNYVVYNNTHVYSNIFHQYRWGVYPFHQLLKLLIILLQFACNVSNHPNQNTIRKWTLFSVGQVQETDLQLPHPILCHP